MLLAYELQALLVVMASIYVWIAYRSIDERGSK